MKNSHFFPIALLFLAFLCTAAPPARAFISDDASHVEIFAGYLNSGHSNGIIGGSAVTVDPSDGLLFGLRAGENFRDNWGFELSAGYADGWDPDFNASGTVTASSANCWMLDASTGFYTHPFKKATFFFFGGLSYQHARFRNAGRVWKSLDGFGLHGGAAFQAFVFPRGGYVRVDGRYRYIEKFYAFEDDDKSLGSVEATVSVGYVF